jgi:hypothetical protein
MISQEEPFKKNGVWDMIAIQEECKKKYPIGCTYEDGSSHVLELDKYTYGIFCNNMIYAHSAGGCLFHHGTWAKLISLPETKVEDKSKFEVEKWSVGTYVVFTKTVSPIRSIGSIDKITDSYPNSVNLEKSANCVMQRETDGEIKWFATKQEAEDFAKTLIIENTYESTSKRVLLEKAKEKYPIGTVIDSLGGMPNEIISTNNPYFVSDDNIRFNEDQLVYSNGEWAKIISKPISISSSFNIQEILEEAKRRFPLGCTFYPIKKDGTLSDTIYTQRIECRIYGSDNGTDWIIGSANIRNDKGQWAEIVSTPKEKEHPFPEVKISEYIPGQNYAQPTPMESYNFKLVDLNPVYKNDKFVLPIIPIITPLLRV